MKKNVFLLLMFIGMSTAALANRWPIEKERINIESQTMYTTEVEKYDFSVNYRRLGVCLGLTFQQMIDLENMYDKFKDEMKKAYDADEAERDNITYHAISNNYRCAKYILNEKQYAKYIVLMDTTFLNRGFDLSKISTKN